MPEYIPSSTKWVAEQVKIYEASGGAKGTTLKGLPVVIVTNIGSKTGAIRKTPLMRVVSGHCYVLVASQGGAPNHPLWYYNLKANPNVEIRDGSKIFPMVVREITDPKEKQRFWNVAIDAYKPYGDYQKKTERIIPILLAELIEYPVRLKD